ncbi:MAG: type II toxin-antitoxin system VapC family toxin [bacterium]|nr:type II toxin-antitoxin system VapC family toxin [bacterium]
MIVIDASAVLELLLRTPTAAQVEELILAMDGDLHAPHLLDLEVAQVLRRYCHTKDITPERAQEALLDLRDLAINRHAHSHFIERIWELRGNVTAYDAAYVALAESLSAPLLTCDVRLAKAPGHNAEIKHL